MFWLSTAPAGWERGKVHEGGVTPRCHLVLYSWIEVIENCLIRYVEEVFVRICADMFVEFLYMLHVFCDFELCLAVRGTIRHLFLLIQFPDFSDGRR